eukprot:m.985328 g.985328  ORF g.985328 m.985328 type:complete len:210 (-) comp23982_c2_seq9:39-668(-)
MMADTTTNSDLEEFLGKIDTIHDLINDIKVSDGTEGDSALKKADEFIERNEVKVTRNRTVINTSAVPSTSAPGQSINAAPVDMSSLPEGVSPEQAAFMASVEQDAKDRAKRRMQREKEALVPKEKGNAAFKEGAYAVAVEHYLEATRIDPANPLLYTNTAQAYIKVYRGNKFSLSDVCWILHLSSRCSAVCSTLAISGTRKVFRMAVFS